MSQVTNEPKSSNSNDIGLFEQCWGSRVHQSESEKGKKPKKAQGSMTDNGYGSVVSVWKNLKENVSYGLFPSSTPEYMKLQQLVDRNDAVGINQFRKNNPNLDIDLPDSNGNTFVMMAALHSRAQSLKALLSIGANPNLYHESTGRTALMIATLSNSVLCVRELLENGADPNLQDRQRFTALMYGCLLENVLPSNALIEHQLTNLNIQQNLGDTALHLACYQSNLEITQNLLRFHADPNVQNWTGATPLIQVLSTPRNLFTSSKLKISQNLVAQQTKNLELKNLLGQTALICACQHGHTEIAEAIIQQNASVTTVDNNGRSPLHYACSSGNIEIVKLLLDSRAAHSLTDARGNTPLIAAASGGHTSCMKLLLSAGSEIDAQDLRGDTSLMYCSSAGHILGVKLLTSNEKPANLNLQNSEGLTALMLAVNGNHYEVVCHLVRLGADLELENKNHHTCLALASFLGHVSIVQELLQKKVQVDKSHSNGWTPLGLACSKGHLEVVQLLVEKGMADVNKQNNFQETPLMIACGAGHENIVQYLLKQRADVNLKNSEGLNSYFIARKRGHKVIASIVKLAGASTEEPNNCNVM
eukprot:c18635_g1_i1.p1 GENE.c18635_g1_i1~~c18635_g1_i1.p1  ORF type:complete len:599 (+),score=223.97 c18635_g1_i1:36-1799(+)